VLFDQKTIQTLEQFATAPWRGIVFRHMFAKFPPERENRRGARWNPPETPAIYTSLLRETAVAEAEYYIGMQSIRPSARRIVYRIKVALNNVLDLSERSALLNLDVQSSLGFFLLNDSLFPLFLTVGFPSRRSPAPASQCNCPGKLRSQNLILGTRGEGNEAPRSRRVFHLPFSIFHFPCAAPLSFSLIDPRSKSDRGIASRRMDGE
jgi:hypothetical protein